MGGPRSSATESDLREAWDSGEPFKAAAARIGMSPNTLRSRWKEMFGEEAFTERGKRLQAAAAAETARAISTTRVYSDVEVPCSACSTSVTLKSNQVAHLDRSLFKCEQCSGDRDCPVCGQRVDGERGLSGHFRHRRDAGDREHGAYELGEMDALWAGRSEPSDYVTCRRCGTYRGQNLTSHFQSAHPEVVGQYGVLYPGALVMTVWATQRIANNRINLTALDLAPFKDKQGRVEVAKAAEHFGCVHWTVLRYCKEHKLPTRNRLAFQKRVLDLVSEALGTPYIWEWSHTDIVNPRTGYRLYFDGLFATHNLIVEAQGKQHYEYIPYWHKTEAEFRARREVDAHKIREAEARGYKVLEVRYDEPFTDPMYLAGRLVQLGVLSPRQVPHLEHGG